MNTGKKIYRWLIEIDAATGLPTGRRKANLPSDPDYVAPVIDLTLCPVGEWFPENSACELDSNGLRTGVKKYLQRKLMLNGTQIMIEDNTLTGGSGPYFPPVIDHTMCEPQSLQLFDYVVVRYRWTIESGRDLDTLSGFVNTGTIHDNNWVGYSQGADVPDGSGANGYICWGGDNTDTGVEAILVNFKKMADDNPLLSVLEIKLNAFWWGSKGTGDVEVQLETYLGGTMVQQGFDFVNQGGVAVQSITLNRNVTQNLQNSNINTSTNVANVTYNTISKTANIS